MHYRGRRAPFELRKVHPVQLPSQTYGFALLKDPFYNKGKDLMASDPARAVSVLLIPSRFQRCLLFPFQVLPSQNGKETV